MNIGEIRDFVQLRCNVIDNQTNNQSIIPSTDVIQLTLTLKMTTAQFFETTVIVNNNSPIQDYAHPDDQTQPTFDMTPGFKPFTILIHVLNNNVIHQMIYFNRKGG